MDELKLKFFTERDPETTQEKLDYATAILEIYADPNNWSENRDPRYGPHRLGMNIVLNTGNIIHGYQFAEGFFKRVKVKPPRPITPLLILTIIILLILLLCQ